MIEKGGVKAIVADVRDACVMEVIIGAPDIFLMR
jgi:hypothetical protein